MSDGEGYLTLFDLLSCWAYCTPLCESISQFPCNMADERIAEMITQSNAVLAATLAGALQGLRAPPVPTMKLDKFMKYPRRVGDPTVAE